MTYKELFAKASKCISEPINDYRPAYGLYIEGMEDCVQIPNAIVCWLKNGTKIIYIDGVMVNAKTDESIDEIYDRGYDQGYIAGKVYYRSALIELSNSLKKLSGRKVTVDEIVEILEREV